jgi:hypothetical protein
MHRETEDVDQNKEVAGKEALYFLDLKNPRLEQPVDVQREDEPSKFVQVEVVSVTNAKKHGISFRVFFDPKGKEEIYLGSFALFPADNPGKFLVATQGKVTGAGKLGLELTTLEDVKPEETIKVAVKRLSLRKDQKE